ncbi:AGR181Wp [Eremothecium gossypii ATCC 10895]|uniref:Ribosome assembly protein 3 n=1 Tax=Eremothecium gossypii (strain ATCC 10895 / CBS 109.51 / FGSC 9923 / NRRL Y-1056) TaxID=284811 RepID=RSA3_EREGS|nr:AGR181Wp [Eremothecium gossypii ATCC 10895]Q74ZL7.1 RecName: Full=Ribosome assembly protein 3 [Eremothecium gossypii ATCC 10895]AAS54671.1 AGR181Wp [Eremothecium gossypii ATCC 10895]AEY99001.1 FAGR181Wp [Eremothecium gossypii FDAG1]
MSTEISAAAPRRAANGKKRANRRKKRRTQAESDSSDSSDSSESSQPSADEQEAKTDDVAVELSDVELSDSENKTVSHSEKLDDESKAKLKSIQLTATDLSSKFALQQNRNIDLQKAGREVDHGLEKLAKLDAQTSEQESGRLKTGYINMLFEHVGEDVNQLRNAPDFTPKSLVVLANALKDGGDMFDIESLRALVDNK